jgi:polysaccharide export outer membrane protein
LLVLSLLVNGCQHTRFAEAEAGDINIPREKSLYVLPDYIIESPDILLLDAIRVIPKPPYRIAPLDTLIIQVPGAFPGDPIGGVYPVDPSGTVNLGLAYGSVSVVGMTLEQAKAAVEAHLKPIIKENKSVVALGRSRALQQIRGPHIVTPDGKIRLGVYGSVIVSGMTLAQAKAAIEGHLSAYLQEPEIALDVGAYNSKVFYVVFDGGGSGQTLIRLPITGNDTVLDALSQVGGLNPIADMQKIWVARPAVAGAAEDKIMAVDWEAITSRGRTETNYQLFPGDRIYVKANPFVTFDNTLAKVTAPFERLFGVVLLGRSVVGTIAQPLVSNGTNGSNTGLIIR